MPAAVAAFKESVPGRMGMLSCESAARAITSGSPAASFPIKRATGLRRSACASEQELRRSAATIRTPAGRRRAHSAPASIPGNTGRRKMAPADDRTALGLNGLTVAGRVMSAVAPKAKPLRVNATRCRLRTAGFSVARARFTPATRSAIGLDRLLEQQRPLDREPAVARNAFGQGPPENPEQRVLGTLEFADSGSTQATVGH